MKRKRESADGAASEVRRSGRIVKQTCGYSEGVLSGRKARFGKWNKTDKEKLLGCLQRFPGVQYNPMTIFRSIKCKPRVQVEHYMSRLRRRTAEHIEEVRKKQPPILTWFQVADEVTWLKDDEGLHQIIPTLLGIHANEANMMQERNPLLSFSNLYKYLKLLHKSENLPQLTPAESVILLDCFQKLADMLRTSDMDSQIEFMRKQYKSYFHHLYFSTSTMSECGLQLPVRERKANLKRLPKSQTKPKASPGQKSSVGPLLKAELRKKKSKRKAKGVEKSQAEAECQSSQAAPDISSEIHEQADKEVENSQKGSEYQSSCTGQEGSNNICDRSDVDSQDKERNGLDDMHGNSQVPINGVADQNPSDSMNIHDPPHHNLDPNDTDFLAKFASLFSLGSLNPFEIPAELMNIRPRPKAKAGSATSDAVSGGTDRDTDVLQGSDVEGHQSKDDEIDIIADCQNVPGTSFSTSDTD